MWAADYDEMMAKALAQMPPDTDAKRRWRAVVRADGSLQCDAESGSIHGLGAKLQDAPSCNGWTFWQVDPPDGLKPIDSLRQTSLLATEP